MVSLKVLDVKTFTKNIFVDNVFDNFVASSVEVNTFSKFSIDGHINKKWFDTDELENIKDDYIKWADLKKYVYDMIKGSKVPSSFKIILLLSNENMQNTIRKYSYNISDSDVDGLFINIMYENGELHIITGISYKTFVLDKSLDKEWDNSIKLFLNKHEIPFDVE